MTQMNPVAPLPDSPPGEIELFHALAQAPGTEDWVAIQGLQLADHGTQMMGEVDFVVIVPGAGILVVEVKSHRSISRDESGAWRLGRDKPTNRSPFKQSLQARFAVTSWMRRRGIVADYPIWHAVWTTSLKRQQIPASPEWHSWELLDSDDLKGNVKEAIVRTLRFAHEHLKATRSRIHADTSVPSKEEARRIAAALRADFVAQLSVDAGAAQRRAELEAFLPEQIRVLDYLRNVDQLAVVGAAGTGKTHVAIEAARRASVQGERVLLVVFNRLLAAEIGDNPQLASDLIRVTTLHKLLMDLASVNEPTDFDDKWWSDTLPSLALEKILDDPLFMPICDVLIVDEGQDVLLTSFAPVLDLLVKGGLANGRTVIAGDFENQAIFAGEETPLDLVKELQPRLVVTPLTVNCRSTRGIGRQANVLARLSPGYEEFRRPEDGVLPTLAFTVNDSEAKEALVKEVHRYLDERYALNEIVILSSRRDSLANSLADRWFRDRVSAGFGKTNLIRTGTIHEFKGLESPVVIVTDIDAQVRVHLRELLYVGITRATSRLTLIADKLTISREVQGGNNGSD